ncbi:ribosome-recycling factor, mitochondrial isoform X5 [Pteropus medius]|nr:ribosome-recycling factor, mitochondrial isoform X5 [Pteropus giganteus]
MALSRCSQGLSSVMALGLKCFRLVHPAFCSSLAAFTRPFSEITLKAVNGRQNNHGQYMASPAVPTRLFATKKAKAKAKGQPQTRVNLNTALVEDIISLEEVEEEMKSVMEALKDNFNKTVNIRTSPVYSCSYQGYKRKWNESEPRSGRDANSGTHSQERNGLSGGDHPHENMPLAKDLLHPSPEEEGKHKKKRLVQSPKSCFRDVKCPGCYKITTAFSHAQMVVLCVGCSTVFCQPTGGKVRLTEGCSFRRKQH